MKFKEWLQSQIRLEDSNYPSIIYSADTQKRLISILVKYDTKYEICGCTVKQLKEKLKAKGLSKTGRKQQLIERLWENDMKPIPDIWSEVKQNPANVLCPDLVGVVLGFVGTVEENAKIIQRVKRIKEARKLGTYEEIDRMWGICLCVQDSYHFPFPKYAIEQWFEARKLNYSDSEIIAVYNYFHSRRFDDSFEVLYDLKQRKYNSAKLENITKCEQWWKNGEIEWFNALQYSSKEVYELLEVHRLNPNPLWKDLDFNPNPDKRELNWKLRVEKYKQLLPLEYEKLHELIDRDNEN